MKILIENYRKFEIYFDTDEESFYSVSDYYDTDSKKKSYASTKKAIDEWIKVNSGFRAFNVIKSENWKGTPTSNSDNLATVTGQRKDGHFIIDGKAISEYNEKDYYLSIPENDPIFEKMAPHLKEIETLQAKIKDKHEEVALLTRELILITLKDHKKTLREQK